MGGLDVAITDEEDTVDAFEADGVDEEGVDVREEAFEEEEEKKTSGAEPLELLDEGTLEEENAEEAEVSLDEIIRQQFGPPVFEPDLGERPAEHEPEEEEREERPVWLGPDGTILPLQLDEFVCRRCLLIKRRFQLADPIKLLCRDCAAA